MKRIILISIGWLISSNLNGQNLENHNWVNRVIIVKTKQEHSNKYQKQIEEISLSKEEFKDRKLIAYQITGSKYSLKDYENIKQEKSGELSMNLTKEILNKKNDFEIILIGLDGRIKLRKTDIVSKEELFSNIDLMPIRKAELKSRSKEN